MPRSRADLRSVAASASRAGSSAGIVAIGVRRGRRRPAAPPCGSGVSAGAVVQPVIEEALQLAFLRPRVAPEKPTSGRPAARTSSMVSTPASRDPPRGSRPARRRPSCRCRRGPAPSACRVRSRPGWRRSIVRPHGARRTAARASASRLEDAGAQAVVDVVIVIGDIVGDRRDLRLEARPAAELERRKPRSASAIAQLGAATGPLCLARPSSVSQLRLSPSKSG